VFVGGQGTTGSAITLRWALDRNFLLFADDSGDTQAGCVASFYYTDRNMDMNEVMALGGVNASGANVPGLPPPPIGISTPRRVDIIGHRGKSCCAPENTLTSMEQAFQTGATDTEIDIHRSSDGVAVLMHDSTVNRTTDGVGRVDTMTVEQLKQLDAGSWFGPQYAGTRVPTLVEAMTLAKQYGRKLYLDLKLNGLGPAVAAAVAETEFAEEDLWLWHYGPDSETTALLQHVPGGKVIYEPAQGQAGNPEYFENLKNLGVWGFDGGAGNGNISAAFVQAAHNAGMYVSAYTILDPDAMRRAILNGVDGMETDFTHVLDAMMPRHGDLNLDALVDRADLAALVANFGQAANATWAQGNFELPYANRAVNLTDLWLLQTNLSVTGAASQVPEPQTFLFAAAAIFLLRRRAVNPRRA
jgi:glycerophosphoryl diester phosphodiesterase